MQEIHLGDVVRLRKKHPCGSTDWEVVRLGADIGLRCIGCGRRVLLPRREFNKRLKAIISSAPRPLVERTSIDKPSEPDLGE